MRRLSSNLTFFGKYLVPPLFIGVLGWATLSAFLGPAAFTNSHLDRITPLAARWGLLLAWLYGGFAAVRQALPMKQVRLDGNTLLISNYFTEHRVPLSLLIDVRQGRWFDRTVVLEFADPNPFNGIVTFQPAKPTGQMVWRDDAVVLELRRLAGLDSAPPQGRAT